MNKEDELITSDFRKFLRGSVVPVILSCMSASSVSGNQRYGLRTLRKSNLQQYHTIRHSSFIHIRFIVTRSSAMAEGLCDALVSIEGKLATLKYTQGHHSCCY